MKKTVVTLLALLFTAGTCFAGTAISLTGSVTNSERPERHPLIEKAINALQSAKGDLENAAHDYCGHRVEALEATNNAIRQLHLALESDRASIEPPPSQQALAFFEKVTFTPEPSSTEAASGFERHPKIHQAIDALERAKTDLQNASHDYHGHREDAVESINRALDQLGKAIECDRH